MNQVAVYGKYKLNINFIFDANHFYIVWSWSMPTMGMSSRKYALTRKERLTSKKRRFGMFSSR